MKKVLSLFVVSMVFSVLAVAAFCEESSPTIKPVGTTQAEHNQALIQNLQAAHSTESHESMLYASFAKKADEEGFGQVASLFRALSKAEEIHSTNKASLIEQLGGNPEAQPKPLVVGTTQENLDWALDAEHHEKETMYTEYAEQAAELRNSEVAQSFEFCLAAEPWHVQVLEQARKDLADYTGSNIDFHVCPVCGNTVRSMNFEKCRVCDSPKKDFLAVR